MSLVLYDFHGSPCARRVRAVLLEKGLAWETRLVDLTRMEQYLDEIFPGPRLYPPDAWERAQVKMWQAFELAMAKEFRPLMYRSRTPRLARTGL